MARPQKSLAKSFGDAAPSHAGRLGDGLSTPTLPLFRFRLRQLLALVAALSVLLAGLVQLEGIPAMALLLAALVVSLHLFSTALGSQLRRHADSAAEGAVAEHSAVHGPAATRLSPQAPQPRPQPWYARSGASLSWLPRLVATAMLLGGCAGAIVLAATMGQRTSPAGLVVGAASVGIVSGWFAFLGGSFVAIVRGGLSEAVAENRQDESRHTSAAS